MESKIETLSSEMKEIQVQNASDMQVIRDEMLSQMKLLNEDTVTSLKTEIANLTGNISTGRSETTFEKVGKQIRDINLNDETKITYAHKLITGLGKNQLIVKCAEKGKQAMNQRMKIADSLLGVPVNNIISAKTGDVIANLGSKELVEEAKVAIDAYSFEDEIVTKPKDKLKPKIRICVEITTCIVYKN